MKTIVWFRQDLRIADNPALKFAAERGSVLPLFILDDEEAGQRKRGSASKVWLHHALNDLNKSLNGQLVIARGTAGLILNDLIEQNEIEAVFWNRCYEPWRISRDKRLKTELSNSGIQVESFNGSLLWEPWEIKKKDDTPYKVFTPFYEKGCLSSPPPRDPLPVPDNVQIVKAEGLTIEDLNLLPVMNWHEEMIARWVPTETGAIAQLEAFIDDRLERYAEGRDVPSLDCTSRLSPYLHFGQISPQQVWSRILQEPLSKDRDKFRRELGWREFSYSLLFHFPQIQTDPLQKKFETFPWIEDKELLEAWQRGQTGIPIIDAGMRELWQTGYMHNRVRMIVASFLTKNLLIHWHEGERWFRDCLVDADEANNPASWQWVAGSGADAAPYFRIFNPVTQGQKFDPEGAYVRRFVPELSQCPKKFIHNPWEAPSDLMRSRGIEIGKTYPFPIGSLKATRERALAAFKGLSS